MKQYKFGLQVLALAALIAAFVLITPIHALARDVQESQYDSQEHMEGVVSTQTLIDENLNSGIAADVYRLRCRAECIRVNVNDAGTFNDTRFKVTVIGSSPNFVGEASAISPEGGFSIDAEVCSGANKDLPRRAYVIITQVNAAGAENYNSSMLCRLADGSFIDPNIVKILDR